MICFYLDGIIDFPGYDGFVFLCIREKELIQRKDIEGLDRYVAGAQKQTTNQSIRLITPIFAKLIIVLVMDNHGI